MNSTDIAIRLANAGLGWTVLPWSAVSAELERHDVEILKIKGHQMERELSLCVAKDRPQDTALRVVQEQTVALIHRAVRDHHWHGVNLIDEVNM